MDAYTKKTKAWLDDRFKKCSETGIYYAHQPIYGFREDHSEPQYACRYIKTYRIMKELSRLEFDSLLDVGGAEGYKAYLAKELFGIRVENSDLSEEACKRVEEIFHLKSTAADIHNLPFSDNQFDVILCSETLEHVAYLDKALNEILRVAKKALVITVPCEDKQITDKVLREEVPHGHIHSFDLKSLDFLKSQGYGVFPKKMNSPLLSCVADLIEGTGARGYHKGPKKPKILFGIYNICISLFGVSFCGAFRTKAITLLVALDDFVCRFTSSHGGICFLILKNSNCYGKKKQKISVRRIMDLKVP